MPVNLSRTASRESGEEIRVVWVADKFSTRYSVTVVRQGRRWQGGGQDRGAGAVSSSFLVLLVAPPEGEVVSQQPQDEHAVLVQWVQPGYGIVKG